MAYPGAQYAQYGALPAQPQLLEAGLSKGGAPLKPFQPKKRARFSVNQLCASLFFPWILFIVLSAVVTFRIHYASIAACWTIVALGLLLTIAIGVLAVQKAQMDSSPTWWLFFLFGSSLLAVVGAAVVSDLNFWDNMQPYYDLQSLATYSDINPNKNSGRQMMDAGVVEFIKGSKLDRGKAYMFQHLENYCVTPVTVGDETLASYDFWAVGLNCCNFNFSHVVDYKCGPYKSPTARMGVRLMSENRRDFYRLAVQQAEAKYRINAKNPIFFHWTEDAHEDEASYSTYGVKHFWYGVLAFFALQVLMILIASFFITHCGEQWH